MPQADNEPDTKFSHSATLLPCFHKPTGTGNLGNQGTYTSNGILGNMGTHRSTGNLSSRSNLSKKGTHKSNLGKKGTQRSKDNPGNEGQYPCNIGNDGYLTMNGNVKNHGSATAAVVILKNKASMGLLIT
jgi:hypothetical protein